MKNEFLIKTEDIEQILHAHDGDCALLYLWSIFSGSNDLEKAAGDLFMTLSQVRDAAEKLGRMKLFLPYTQAESSEQLPSVQLSPVQPAPAPEEIPLPADELPEYTSTEIEACANSDSGFKAVLDATRQILGKQLTRHDMSRMLGIYNHLGLSAEVIYVLLHYCADRYRGPEGAARKPTIRAIEREAFLWANKELNSPEEAEAYVEEQKQLHSSLNSVKTALEIYDRKLIPSEEAYFTSWLEMGFSVDVIRLAYERTVKNTGKRALPYMNKILAKWSESGLHTIEEIEKQDSPSRKGSQRPEKNGKPRPPFTPTNFDD